MNKEENRSEFYLTSRNKWPNVNCVKWFVPMWMPSGKVPAPTVNNNWKISTLRKKYIKIYGLPHQFEQHTRRQPNTKKNPELKMEDLQLKKNYKASMGPSTGKVFPTGLCLNVIYSFVTYRCFRFHWSIDGHLWITSTKNRSCLKRFNVSRMCHSKYIATTPWASY